MRLERFLVVCVVACAGLAQSVPEPVNWTTEQDHRNMMEQLGIKALRPGPSGREGAPNPANYDEALANPFPVLPDPLRLTNGKKVTSAKMWWDQRRPEIIEDFSREVVGRIPADVPKVAWTVTETVETKVGGKPVVGKRLVGRVDNSSYPPISVDIQMVLVIPADAARPVPVMTMFGRLGLPDDPPPSLPGGFRPPPSPDPPASEQLIAAGWGYAYIQPTSIQADNGAGLTRGIIGLVNKGQARKPEDWGALRAWAWGASRGLDYLETDKAVDAKGVGIEGVSRYGKAALISMAFDTRFFVVLVGSSGEGGAKWLDQQGSYMAAVAAGPVFRLLGAKDLGKSDDYLAEKMPPVNAGLLDGHLAWRQHDGGHTDGPNWKYFIPWVSRFVPRE